MLKIRPIKNQDFNQITQIEFEAFIDPYSKEIFQHLATTAPDLFLVAVKAQKDHDVVYGYAAAEIDEYLQYRVGHILSIAVSIPYRNKGLGHQLLSELISVLRVKKCKGVVLEVRVSNYSAKVLYEKLGFFEVKRIRKYYGNGEDAIVMILDLEEKR
ncbi:MAG: ribosomal protein S18-alanine N-acetyltransferase [Candidatus Thorarchaeota archaeon]